MFLYEYNVLCNDEKAQILWDNGVFVVSKQAAGFTINLYALFDFYVEVWYNVEKNNIVKFQTFKSISRLAPYLDLINLELQ
jgi:hypothetical protein